LGGPRRRLAAVAVAVAGGAVAAPYLWAHRSGTDAADRVYYGTDTRAGEIAIGVLLAAVVYRAVTDGERIGPRTRRTVSIVSTVAGAMMLVALVSVPETSAMWTKGGFVAYAVLSAAIVAAAALEIGPVGALGRSRMLRRLGVLSYAVYLVHWPLLWLADQGLTWPAPVTFACVMAISVAGASVSYRFYEQPLRHTGRLGPISLTAVIAVGVVVAVSGASLASTGRGDTIDFAAARADLAVSSPAAVVARAEVDDTAASGTQTLGTVATVPTRIAFYGDSTAVMTGKGVKGVVEARAARGDGSLQVVPGGAELGCGIMTADRIRTSGGTVGQLAQKCLTWPERWAATIAAGDPDISVVQVGPWETFDLAWDGTDGWHHLGDPVADQHARDLIATAIDELAAGGAHVVFLTATAPAASETPNPNGPCGCPERIERWNQLVEEVASEHSRQATVVDLAGWLAAQDPAEARRLLADGIHFSETTAREVAERWLIERITTAGSRG
jgi:lysophospholipase L1-like esterase/uncharacterized membrane protein